MTNSAAACSNSSSLDSQQKQSFTHQVCLVADISVLCSRTSTPFSRAELLNVSLAVSFSLLNVLSDLKQIEDAIFFFHGKDFNSNMFATQVYNLNSCRVISRNIVTLFMDRKKASALILS